MGGSSKKQRIGYALLLNQHNTLGLGVYDKITSIDFDDKNAWNGEITDTTTLTIDQPNLFGDQGGIVGDIDIEFGKSTQTRNSYMMSILGNLIPAFRGCLGMVFKNVNIGLSPSLRTVTTTAQRIHKKGVFGDAQWYDEKAAIPFVSVTQLSSTFWDYKLVSSASTDETWHQVGFNPDTTWTTNQTTAPFVSGTTDFPVMFDDTNVSKMLYLFNFIPYLNQPVYLNIGATVGVVDVWLNGNFVGSYTSTTQVLLSSNILLQGANNVLAMSASGGEHPEPLYYSPPSGYGQITIPQSSNYVPANAYTTPSAIEAAHAGLWTDVYHTTMLTYTSSISAIDPSLWNTFPAPNNNNYKKAYFNSYSTSSVGGYSPSAALIIYPSDTTNAVTFEQANVATRYDMNPIHIIREVWTNKLNGLEIDESLIDDDILTTCADTIYSEGLGMSLFWDGNNPNDIIKKVCAHIDAVVREDETTGKLSLKLIRNDYDITDTSLIRLNENNSKLVDKGDKLTFWALNNTIIVNYYDALARKNSTIKIQNLDLLQRQGKETVFEVTYDYFTNSNTASKGGLRDSLVQSYGLKSRTVLAFSSVAKNLKIGDVVLYSYSKHNLSLVPFRILKVDKGTIQSNYVELTMIQDKFTLPSNSIIAPVYPQLPPTQFPQPSPYRLLFELPYLVLVQNLGQSNVDSELASNPQDSYFGIAASNPSGAKNGTLYDDIGAGYNNVGILDWCPVAKLNEDIDYLTDTFSITDGIDLNLVDVGTWLQIDDELMLITALSSSSISVKHGILDTIPAKHLTNAIIFMWADFYEADKERLIYGDLVKAKVLTNTSSGQLSLSAAPEDELNIVGRPAKPYNVANLKINGTYFNNTVSGDLVLTWANRNRLTQTASAIFSFEDGNISPESSMTISVNVINSDTSIGYSATGLTGTGFTISAASLETCSHDATLEIFTVRDGLESFQKYEIPFFNLNSETFIDTESGDQLTTESGDTIVMEHA